jgi:hypothetical protein
MIILTNHNTKGASIVMIFYFKYFNCFLVIFSIQSKFEDVNYFQRKTPSIQDVCVPRKEIKKEQPLYT